MNDFSALLSWIFFGDFGLLTTTPRYLFLVLFPVMVFLGLLGQVLTRIPFLKKAGSGVRQLFYIVPGLGCTTAALTALPSLDRGAMNPFRQRMTWVLILLIPCSSQLALIATFACLVTFRVFAVYLAFCAFYITVLYALLSRLYPLPPVADNAAPPITPGSVISVFKDALLSVCGTILPFSVGSVLISLAMYFGLLDYISDFCGPLLDRLLHLPPQAANLLLLNVLKRDFSSASLLAYADSGAFDAVQLVVLLVMLTFSVPCFNSSILLYKQQRLPMACFIWLGSLAISVLLGMCTGKILLVCFV